MGCPRAHLRKDPLGSVSASEAGASPAGDFACCAQSAGVEVAGADGAELALRRIRLSVVEDVPPEATGPPALDRAVALADCAGEVPAGGDVGERAFGRVRVSAPAGDAVVVLADGAVVPVAGANRRVAAFGDREQVCWSAAPAVDSAADVESAGVVAAGIEGDVAVGWGGRGGFGEGQEGEEQRGDRKGDQEEFMPPPPPIG